MECLCRETRENLVALKNQEEQVRALEYVNRTYKRGIEEKNVKICKLENSLKVINLECRVDTEKKKMDVNMR